MQIKISARHGHLSDDNQKFIHDKAEKLLHYFERLTMIEVTVDLQKDARLVEFVARAEHKHEFVARESHGELHAAVDLCMDKIQGQIRRYKEKIMDHRRTPSAGEVSNKAADESAED